MKKPIMRAIAMLVVVQITLGAAPELFLRGTTFLGKLASTAMAEVLPQRELPEAWSIGESGLGETMTSGDWSYAFRILDGYAVVTGYTGAVQSSLTVPACLGGQDVVGLASMSLAFEALEHVYLDGNITWIAEDAFGESKPVIHGLSGTYGLYFASANGYDYVNESEGVFVEGVIDYSDAESERISIMSGDTVMMNSLEADRLETGSIFYMENSDGVPSIYKVTAISSVSDCETMLSVATPELKNAVVDLKKNGSFSIGIDELKISDDALVVDGKLEFNLDFNDKKSKVKVKLGYKADFTYDTYVLGGEVVSGTMSCIHKYTVDVSLETTLADGSIKEKKFETVSPSEFAKLYWGAYGNKDVSVDKKLDGYLSVIKEKSIASYTMPMNFFHLAVDVGCGFKITGMLAGHWEESYEQEYTYDYYSQKWRASKGIARRNEQRKATVSGRLEGAIYVKLSVSVGIIGVLDAISASVDIGIKATISAEASLVGTPSDEAYCMEICIVPYMTGSIKLGVWGKKSGIGFNLIAWKTSFSADLDDVGLKDKVTIHYNTKLGFHTKENCVFSNRLKVSFDTRCGQEIPYVLVLPHLTVEHKPEYDLADHESFGAFLGWADSPNATEPNWVFGEDGNAVTKDVTLYAIWENTVEVRFESRTEQPIKSQYVPLGGYLVEPGVLAPEGKELLFWYTLDSEGKAKVWNFAVDAVLSEGTVLYAHWEGSDEDGVDDSYQLSDIVGSPADVGSYAGINLADYADIQSETKYFKYTINKDSAGSPVSVTITGLQNNPVNLGIPSQLEVPFSYTDSEGKPQTRYESLPVAGYSSSAFQNNTTIKSVFVESGAPSINIGSLFKGCSALQYADLHNASLTKVSNYMFADCTSLKCVDLPDGVTVIEWNAFQNCKSLQLAVLQGITHIYNYAFLNCASLLELYLPDTLSYLASGDYPAFQGCTNLRRISVGGLPEIKARMLATGSTKLEELEIRGTVGKIGDNAFDSIGGYYLANRYDGNGYHTTDTSARLIIGEGVQSIGAYAFRNCDVFTEIYLPDSLTTMGSYAFCDCDRIPEVDFPESLTTIPGHSFDSCNALERIRIPASVKSIGDTAFGNCARLKEVEIAEGVTHIYNYAFLNCASLLELYLPDTLSYLASGDYPAFQGCTNLRKISVGGLPEIKPRMLATGSTKLEELEIRGTVGKIGDHAFDSIGGYYLANRHDGNGYHTTGTSARLIIGEGVQSIGEYAFRNCDVFTEIYLPDSLTTMGSYAFYDCSRIGMLRVGANTTSIASNAFDRCSKFVACVQSGNDAAYNYFHNKGYTLGHVDAEGAIHVELVYDANGGVFIDGTTSIAADQKWSETILLPEPPSNGDSIFCGWYTDADCTKKWSAETVPATGITLYAGWNIDCYTVYLNANGGSINRNGEAVESCSFVAQKGTNPAAGIAASMEGMSFVGWFTDADCQNPFAGTMPASDLNLYAGYVKNSKNADYIFENGEATLVNYDRIEYESTILYLPAEVNGMPLRSIAAGALSGTDFTTIYIPETVTSLEAEALAGMNDLESIVVNEENPVYRSVDGVLFSKDGTELILYPAKRALSYRIPDGVNRIGARAFEGSIIRSVMLNNDLAYIGDAAFAETKIAAVRFPDGLIGIGDYAYAGTEISTLKFPASLTSIGKGAFSSCKNVSWIKADATLTSIGSGAFSFCASPLAIYGPMDDCAIQRYAEENNLYYNQYMLNLNYPDGSIRTYIYKAGSMFTLPIEVEKGENTEFTGWYMDAACSDMWDASAPMPQSELNLYAGTRSIFAYETVTTVISSETDEAGNVVETTKDSLALTKYQSENEDAVVPESIGGLTVTHLKAGCFNEAVISVTIPASVISIEDGAIPAGAAIITVPGSAAEEYARNNGFSSSYDTYSLNWETNGGAEIESERIVGGSIVALKLPVRSGYSFAGWYNDADLTSAVESNEAGEIIMPHRDLTLYASWEITDVAAANISFTYMQNDGAITVTGLAEGVTELKIPETLHGLPVTTINKAAFASENELVSVHIPGSISAVPENAFRNCAKLASVILAEGVAAIDRAAFYGCSQLTELSLPNSIVKIGADAFCYCGLDSLILGRNLAEFDVSALNGCEKLAEILVSEDNEHYSSDKGVLYDDQNFKLLKYPQGRTDDRYSVRKGTTIIGADAFRNAAVKQVVLSAECIALENGAFAGSSLSILPDFSECRVTVIPDDCFSSCAFSGEIVLPDGIVSLERNAFAYCDGIVSVAIPNSTETISSSAFSGIFPVIHGAKGSAAESFAIERGLLFTDPECTVLPESISISETRVELKRGGMHQLRTLILPENSTNTSVSWLVANEEIVHVSDGGMLRAISGGETTVYAFTKNNCVASCTVYVDPTVEVEEIILNQSEATISTEDSLQLSVTCLPNNATYRTVEWSSSDESVATVDENGLVIPVLPGTVVISAMAHNGIVSDCTVTVFAHVSEIGFDDIQEGTCYNIGDTQQLVVRVLPEYAKEKSVVYSTSNPSVATVDEQGIVSFVSCGYVTITAVSVDNENASASIDLECMPESVLELPAALKNVESEAFADLHVQCVIIPEGTKSIGSRAFANCDALYKVVIPESVAEIADDAFEDSVRVTICADAGSYAQNYAIKHGIDFREKNR